MKVKSDERPAGFTLSLLEKLLGKKLFSGAVIVRNQKGMVMRMEKANNGFKRLLTQMKSGIIDNNPTFVLVLGMCPTLATTTSVTNALGMGLATTAVLAFSNLFYFPAAEHHPEAGPYRLLHSYYFRLCHGGRNAHEGVSSVA